MMAFLFILAVSAVYFAWTARFSDDDCPEAEEDTDEAVPALAGDLLTIELEKDDDGRYHAVILDLADDSVLFVTDGHATTTQAVREAQRWMERCA